MAETVNGVVGVFWGLATGVTGTGVAATFKPQSLQFGAEADNVTVRDGNGDTVASIWFDQRHTLTIDVIPTGATLAAAAAASIVPQPGAIITIADAEDPEIDATNSGKYELISATKSRSNNNVASISMQLRQWVDNDVAVLVSAGP